MSVVEIVDFAKGFLKVLPVIEVADDVADVSIESADHTLANDELCKSDLVARPRVAAEHDKRKNLIDKRGNKVDNLVVELLFLL